MRPFQLLVVFLLLLPCANAQQGKTAQALAPLRSKPTQTNVHPVYHGTALVIKFRHDSGIHLEKGQFAHVEGTNINAILNDVAIKRERHIQLPKEQLDAMRRNGEQKSGLRLHDLNLFFRIELSDRAFMANTCDRLNAFDLVEIAYPIDHVSDPIAPPRPPFRNPTSAPPLDFLLTPDFSNSQDYRNAAPIGIDADYGQFFSGSRGENTLIADVETGWTDDHEDIRHKALGAFVGLTPAPYPWDHGTAVLGELVGEDNGFGVRGIVFEADIALSSHLGSSSNIPTAIANATAAVEPGDFVVLEVQCSGSVPGPFPCEFDPATFAIVQTATAIGIHVFAAAGNGSNDLDSAIYGDAFNRVVRDSGAVMIGASNGSSLFPAGFSNYGSRLDAHGWGYDVTTSGYGDLHFGAGVTEEYTAVFSGTSSATPIVTGAGVMLNGIFREAYGHSLAPLDLRKVITESGTPQMGFDRIGPRPNVRVAIQAMHIPTLSIGGSLIPGGTLNVQLDGIPGDNVVLHLARALAPAPQRHNPFGFFFLDQVDASFNSIIPPSGSMQTTLAIPNIPALSGRRGYMQAQLHLASTPGLGAYSNYVEINIQ